MKSNSVIPSLKRLFYIAIGIQIALFVSFAFKWINILPSQTAIPIALERYTVLITLIGIPGALKLFSVMMKKNNNTEDENISTDIYKKAFLARFGLLFLVASLNIILYAVTLNQNFMLLALITFVAYIFSYPSKSYLNVIEEDEEQENGSREHK